MGIFSEGGVECVWFPARCNVYTSRSVDCKLFAYPTRTHYERVYSPSAVTIHVMGCHRHVSVSALFCALCPDFGWVEVCKLNTQPLWIIESRDPKFY